MQINFFLILGFSFLILIISIIIGWNNLYNSKREINKNIINNEDKKDKYNDYDYDLIIVGGGLSGLTAAYEVNKLTNNSMKILLLEVSSTYGGNSINEIDGINILLNEKSNDINIIKDNFSLFYNDSFEFGQFLSETDLLTKLVNNSHELVDFIFNDLNCNNLKIIKSEGSRFPRTFVSNIPNITTGKYISDKIYNKLKKINSTKILLNSHFIDLLISPNHTIVKGVKYTLNNNNNSNEIKNISVKSKAVILCTGGYGSDFYTNESILNESLVQLYYFPTFLTKYTRGEGLKISRNKGAELIYQRYGEIYPTCFVN
jgi:succinate dehydrogenase/fumarate reductase flavoprotein subunit